MADVPEKMDLDPDQSAASPPTSASQPISLPSGVGISQPQTAISQPLKPFKFKYPQAAPAPPGENEEEWNKIFTAADSRIYNRAHKNANESRKAREAGETRVLALQMLQQKKEKRMEEQQASASGSSATKKPNPKASAAKKAVAGKSKNEPTADSREATPGGDKMSMSISEKIKSEGRPRKAASVASSSAKGTPAPSTAQSATAPATAKMSPPPAAPKIEKPAQKKKGTAAPVKKTKRTKKGKAEDAVSASPASPGKSQTAGPNDTSSDDDSNDGGEYCLCRGPDDHRMMVYCDGGCDEWYHCSCVGIDVDDAKELLDRFVCPKCKTDQQFTTWKRMCRYYNVNKCRKAARVNDNPPSKYCSEEHAEAFAGFVVSRVRSDNEPSKGGALNRNEIGQLLKGCKTGDDVRALGQKPRLPKKEGGDPSRSPGLDYLTPEEEKTIAEIKLKKPEIERKIAGYDDQMKLCIMVSKRRNLAQAHPSNGGKDICGYDNRLAFNDVQFLRWKNTTEGKTALETGVLGPRTAETRDINLHVPYENQLVQEAPEVAEALNNICLNHRKKCAHLGWGNIHMQDFNFAQKLLREELAKLNKKVDEIIDDAETREATKDYDAENTTEQLF